MIDYKRDKDSIVSESVVRVIQSYFGSDRTEKFNRCIRISVPIMKNAVTIPSLSAIEKLSMTLLVLTMRRRWISSDASSGTPAV